MGRKCVSIVKFDNRRENLAKAVELAGGLETLRPSDHILIKPNLVMWDSLYPYPKFGVLTTSLLVEEMVRLLKNYGCTHITIGEGSIVDSEFGSDTKAAFAGLGYHVLRDKYGVQLLDFNDGPFERVDFEGYHLDISSHVRQTDFLINMPVLKIHSNTKISLGLKNLKGCLHDRSKMFCHHIEPKLDGFVSHLATAIEPALTVIDGIYALEKGPVINGRAYRSDLIIASTNAYAADAVGAKVLGFEPAEIVHVRDYGQAQGLSFDDVDVIGEKIEDVALPLSWDWNWLPDGSGPEAFGKVGMTRVNFPKYDNTICSRCSYLNNYLLVSLMGAYGRQPFAPMEFLSGTKYRSQGGYQKSFLVGKCAVEVNKDNPLITEAVPIAGCPPAKKQILETLNLHGIRANDKDYAGYRASMFRRYRNKSVFCEEHFQIC